MSYKIVVDSCCDLTPAMVASGDFISVPLTLRLEDKTFIDDCSLDQADLIWSMKQSENPIQTACPSPAQYMDAYDCGADDVYVVTLSALLSGSHNSAQQGKQLYVEDGGSANIHVFNSCSAAACEALIARKLQALAATGMAFQQVVQECSQFIASTNTLFVLESLDNLRKNGRLSRLQSIVTSTLKLKLLMGATPEGEICKRGQALSIKQALTKLVDMVATDPNHVGRDMVIAHCNCLDRAFTLKNELLKRTQLGEIIITETGGISTAYAYDGGIVTAY